MRKFLSEMNNSFIYKTKKNHTSGAVESVRFKVNVFIYLQNKKKYERRY